MLSSFAQLFALRPFLSIAILGVPVLTLIVVGMLAIWALKLLFFVVLPIAFVVWIARKLMRPRAATSATAYATAPEPVVHDL